MRPKKRYTNVRNYEGDKVDVEYHYWPATRNDDPEVEIIAVEYKGKDVMDEMSEKDFVKITSNILREHGY